MKFFFGMGILFTAAAFLFFIMSNIDPIPTPLTNEKAVQYVMKLPAVKNLRLKMTKLNGDFEPDVSVRQSTDIISSISVKYKETTPDLNSYKFVDIFYKQSGDEGKNTYITTIALPNSGNRFDVYMFDLVNKKFINYLKWVTLEAGDLYDLSEDIQEMQKAEKNKAQTQ